MPGLFAARTLKKRRKKFRLYKARIKHRIQGTLHKHDPLEGAPMAKGIVIAKKQLEQRQPHSGMLKCVRVKLVKNGKMVTAHAPRDKAINFIQEHDEVIIEGIGGSQGRSYGSLPGVRYRVIKVNGVSLEMLRTGRKQRPSR